MSISHTKTTCPYCGVGCGIIVNMHENGRVEVQGDPERPSNYGRLCMSSAVAAYKRAFGEDVVPCNYVMKSPVGKNLRTGQHTQKLC